jgi:CRISPR system Cascade subunit CasA
MQDFELEFSSSKAVGVEGLLIDGAGANTVKMNKDFFVGRDRVPALSMAMAAAALMTLQANAPSGGAGHRTSMRGGGPLTTLVAGRTLWETVWLNVLSEIDLMKVPGNDSLTELHHIFPWLARSRTSQKKGGQDTGPGDLNRLQHYWGMPRRIRLGFVGPGTCGLTGDCVDVTVQEYTTAPSGFNYMSELCRHPLTPYSRPKSDKDWNPSKGQPTGLPYRDWPRIALQQSRDGVLLSEPARCVTSAYDRFQDLADENVEDLQRQLWITGYDMDNMKARCWYSTKTPLLHLPSDPDGYETFSTLANAVVNASEYARLELGKQVREAMFRRSKDIKGDTSYISQRFWSRTEPEFYQTLQSLSDAMRCDGDLEAPREQFLKYLSQSCLTLFHELTTDGIDFAAADVKRIAIAHNTLRGKVRPSAKTFRKRIHLS